MRTERKSSKRSPLHKKQGDPPTQLVIIAHSVKSSGRREVNLNLLWSLTLDRGSVITSTPRTFVFNSGVISGYQWNGSTGVDNAPIDPAAWGATWVRGVPQLIDCMEQGPSLEANRSSYSQYIPRILWNPEGQLPRLQQPATCPYPEPDQSSPWLPSHFLYIHLNIILPSTPVSSKWSLSLSFPHPNPVRTHNLPHPYYMPRPSHPSRFDHLDNIWWGVQNTKNFCEDFRIGVRSSDRRQYSGPLLHVMWGTLLIIIGWADRLSTLPNRLQILSGSDGEQIQNQTFQVMAT